MRYTVRLVFAVSILFGIDTAFAAAENVIDDSKYPRYLFVLSAQSGSLEGNKLTLDGVPNVIYFSDRPNRIAGHMSLEKFLEMWDKGADSFKEDPPNAVLSISDEYGEKNAVLKLSQPLIKENALNFKTRIIEGNIPHAFQNATIFIDNWCPWCY